MKSLIKKVDIYAAKPQFEFSVKNPVIRTYTGSFFSLITIGILFAFTFVEVRKMIVRDKKDYSVGTYSYSVDTLGEIEMKDYNATFDFIIGVQNNQYDFDIIDNKYIYVEANRALTGWNTEPNTDIKMRKCNQKELKAAYGDWASNNINSMCLDNPDDLKIKGNWDRPEYKVPYFMIVECRNTTEKVCASPSEI